MKIDFAGAKIRAEIRSGRRMKKPQYIWFRGLPALN
jgi:hypothetical protein